MRKIRKKVAVTTHLDAEVTPVNVVPQEQVARSLWIPADLKEFHQVVLGRSARISIQCPGKAVARLTYCP